MQQKTAAADLALTSSLSKILTETFLVSPFSFEQHKDPELQNMPKPFGMESAQVTPYEALAENFLTAFSFFDRGGFVATPCNRSKRSLFRRRSV